MSHGHGQFRNMGDFKAIALDYEFWLSNGTDGALYCLDQRDISILLALCEYVGWFTRWINTEDTSAAEIRAIQGELTLKLMSCVDIQVLIDQAKLTANREATNQLLQSQAIRDILADEYDGTPTSINPSAPTTDFGSTGDRYDALCAAITAFVYKFAENQSNVIRLNEIGGLAAVGLIAALLIPGLNVFLVVGAGIAVLLGSGVIGVSSEVAIAALTDQTALGDVICFMRDTLKAESVTEANWNACLDSYPFTTGSHQAIVADFIKAALADNYLPVLDMLGQGYDSVVAGDQLPECPCAPSDLWEIVTCGYGTFVKNSGPASGPGVYQFTFESQYFAGGGINLGDFRWGNPAEQFTVSAITPTPAPAPGVGTGYHRSPGSTATCADQAGLTEGLPVADGTTHYGGIAMTTFPAYPWSIVMTITVSTI